MHRVITRGGGGGKQTHEQTGAKTSVRSLNTQLFRNLDQPRRSTFAGQSLSLVDLRQHGIGRLGDDRSSEPSNQTRSQVNTSLPSIAERGLVDILVDDLRNLLVHDELRHRVRNLLEQDGPKPRIESPDTLILEDLGEPREEAAGELGLGNETDTGGLEGAERDIGEELRERGGAKIYGGSVITSSFIALEAFSLA